METTRQTEKQQTKRQLILRVEGIGIVAKNYWQFLMKVAARYPDRNWEIVEKVSGLGERIITKHSSLLSNQRSLI